MSTIYKCFRCGKMAPASLMVFSKSTKRRFCADYTACSRRSKRAKK